MEPVRRGEVATPYWKFPHKHQNRERWKVMNTETNYTYELHSCPDAVIPAETGIQCFLDAPVSGTGQALQVRHDEIISIRLITREIPYEYR
jgi:hypothetical protein